MSEAATVFLSYSRADSDQARRMRARLAEHGVAAFLDRYGLPAGAPWQPQLEREIARASAVLVLCGAEGLGNWQQREIALALDRQANAGLPVLPVILPGNEEPPVGSFLALNTWVDLRRSPDDPEAWRGLLAGLRGEALDGRAAALAASINPYRGLLAFREQDSGLFFGREREVEALVARVRAPSEHNLLGVIGRSGSGKSSVVFAGLVPALRRSRAPVWDIVSLTPGAAPLAALARALDPAPDGSSALEAAARAERGAALLRDGTATLAQLVRERLARAEERGTERLLLVVDQWEELYGMAQQDGGGRDDAARFAELVIEAGRRAPCTIVLTVRADFYDRLLELPGLRAALADALVPLGPMGRNELVRAIERPAEAVGFVVQRQLTARLLDDLGVPPEGESGTYDAGRLPLLEFALERGWRAARAAGRTTLTAQDHADIGGLEGALEATAEEAYARLSAVGQDAARRLLVSLVSPREDGRDLRVRATVPDDPAAREALAAFSSREARLLAAESDASGRVVAEVTHEALIRHWARLRGWVAANRRTLQRRDDVAAAAARWRAAGEPDSHLLPPGIQLEVGKALMADHGDVLVDDLAPFVARSCAVDEAARRRERARRRRWSAALVALSLSSLGLALYGWAAFQVARKAEGTAVAALEDARRERHLALEQTWRALASLAGEYLRAGDAGTALLLALRAVPERGDGVAQANAEDAALEDRTAGAIWNAMSGLREIAVVQAHAGRAEALALSRDGRTLATGGEDGLVRLWRVGDSGLPQPGPAALRGHIGTVRDVTLSPDGRWAASAGADGTVRLWSLRGGPPRTVTAAHPGGAHAVAFSPDGALLASTGEDAVVRVWRVADPDSRRLVVAAHDRPGRSVGFSSDGQRIASASEDGVVRIASPAGNVPVIELRGHEGPVNDAGFDPTGALVVTADSAGAVRVFHLDAPDAPLLAGEHQGWAAVASFGAEGTRLVSAGEDGELRVWEVAARAAYLPLRGHRGGVLGAALWPDGLRLASVGADGTLRLWRAGPEPSEPTVFREHTHAVQAVAFGAGGALVASGAADGDVVLRDLRQAGGGAPRRLADEARAPVTALAFSRDGSRLAAAGAEGVVRIWSMDDPGASPAAFDAHPLAVYALAFTPDGGWLATAGADGIVRLWGADGRVRGLRVRAGVALRALAIAPDGRTVAAGADDGTIHLWDVSGERPPRTLVGGPAPARSLDFAPDGNRLAVAAGRGELRVLSLDGAAPPVELRGHVGEVASVAFGPLGRRVVSAGQDGTVRVWRADGTGEPWVQRSHDGSAHAVAISDDGRRLATGGHDRTLRVWQLGQGLEEMVERACGLLPRDLTAEQMATFGIDPRAEWPCAARVRGLWPAPPRAADPTRP